MPGRQYRLNQRGWSFFSVLIACAVVGFLLYIAINTYSAKPRLDAQTQQALDHDGIDTSSHRGIVESVKQKVQQLNRRQR